MDSKIYYNNTKGVSTLQILFLEQGQNIMESSQTNQFLFDLQNEAKKLAIIELEKEFLEKQDYINLQKLTKYKEGLR